MSTSFHPDHPVFQVRKIKPEEVPWMLRRNIWTGVLGSTSVTLVTGGVLFTAYAQQEGMQDYQFGVLSTLVSFSALLMLLSPAIETRFGRRKYPWFMLAMFSRLMPLPLLLGFFWHVSPWVIIACVMLQVAASSLGAPLWESWLWDYAPGESFGRFWARRSFWTSLGAAAAALIAGWGVNLLPEQYRLKGICVVFAVAIIIGIIDLLYHVEIPEPPREAQPQGSAARMADALRNAPFRNWVFAVAIWYFAVGIGGPFCLPYMMGPLGFSKNLLYASILSSTLPGVLTLLTLPAWGRLTDRGNPGLVASVSCLAWATIPLFYYLARPESPVLFMVIAWGVGGFFPPGFTVARPLMTRQLSGTDKTAPLVMFYVVVCIGSVLGSATGTLIVGAYGARDVFIVSFAVRVTAALLMLLLLVGLPALARRKSAATNETV